MAAPLSPRYTIAFPDIELKTKIFPLFTSVDYQIQWRFADEPNWKDPMYFCPDHRLEASSEAQLEIYVRGMTAVFVSIGHKVTRVV